MIITSSDFCLSVSFVVEDLHWLVDGPVCWLILFKAVSDRLIVSSYQDEYRKQWLAIVVNELRHIRPASSGGNNSDIFYALKR